MADLIIIRLYPTKPMAASDFTSTLNGLKIEAFDVSFGDTDGGTPLGSASGLADPHLAGTTNNKVDVTKKQILQHYADMSLPAPGRHLEAVATAVIVASAPAGHLEYPTPTSYDVRLKITRGTLVLNDETLEYNVTVTTVGSLSNDQRSYFAAPASLFFALPPPLAGTDPNLAHVDLPADGQPPSFDNLRSAVDAVLKMDPGGGASLASTAPITAAQALLVASEITWNRTGRPQPAPAITELNAGSLGSMYTRPPADPTMALNSAEQARMQFEGDLTAWRATLQAEAGHLAGFIFAASAAVACEKLSAAAQPAAFPVPILTPAIAAADSAQRGVAITTSASADTNFVVPAAYFYALTAIYPSHLDVAKRYDVARYQQESDLLSAFSAALDAKITTATEAPLTVSAIPANAAQNAAQAARRLVALGGARGLGNPIAVTPGDVGLISGWLSHAGASETIVADYWVPKAAAQKADYLGLVLQIITGDLTPLIKAIQAVPLSIGSVTDLVNVTDKSWRDFFLTTGLNPPLPDFTLPGTRTERVEAFLRRLREYFDVPAASTPLAAVTAIAPSGIALSLFDVFQSFSGNYQTAAGTPYKFGSAINAAARDTAIVATFPNDTDAQDWMRQALDAAEALFDLTSTGPAELRVSLMEALYARGFTGPALIAALTPDEFVDALEGSVAYPFAAAIHAKAGPGPSPSTPPGGFSAVNPDGNLVDCVPPCHLSPLGPVQYLHELLHLTAKSDCEGPGTGSQIGTLLKTRRGDLGSLHATAPNADSPVPVIDLVIESLERLAAIKPPAGGAVHDTITVHDPRERLRAIPQYSSPATPVAESGAYTTLANTFTAPELPYAQPLDIMRSYLGAMGTSRYAAMRHFRRRITEFAIDPTSEPADFRNHLWRYPVRFDIAREYLHISQPEYDLLYAVDLVDMPDAGHLLLRETYGFPADLDGGVSWIDRVRVVPQFLRRIGLDYCDFLALWRCGFVVFHREGQHPKFPDCLPCCPDDLVIAFDGSQTVSLRKLMVFVRLWRRLRQHGAPPIGFDLLTAICEVLRLFDASDAIDPDFLRRLAALLMLHDEIRITLDQKLLALWQPGSPDHNAAIARIMDRIEDYAEARHAAVRRPPELMKLIADNLDPLSRLVGFNPLQPQDSWTAHPQATLRFVEVLAKIYGSDFTVGEIQLLFTADPHLAGDDPFPLQDGNEALETPLELPEDDARFGLRALRREIASHRVDDDETKTWTWRRIETALRDRFGLQVAPGSPDPIEELGRHFFPGILEHDGHTISSKQRRWSAALTAAATTSAIWNAAPERPLRYDGATQELWLQLPLRDHAVTDMLAHIRQLSAVEQVAVRSVVFGPRTTLAPFACVFEDVEAAFDYLLGEPDEMERFAFFRAAFARFIGRCKLIAAHLADHVDAVAGAKARHHDPAARTRSVEVAWRVLRGLRADENFALSGWENDNGTLPAPTYPLQPAGGAFAAILGLLGTGLLGTFTPHGASTPVWRDARGPLNAFGAARNRVNAPVATVLPAMDLTLTLAQKRFVDVRNGFAFSDADGTPLGGAERFVVRWEGVLQVDHGGSYRFHAGAPTPEGDVPNFEAAEPYRWRLTLRRGQKSWVVLNHRWAGENAPGAQSTPISLRPGAYGIAVDFDQCQPTFGEPEFIHPRSAGFQLKYAGPDSEDAIVTVPREKLFLDKKDATLGAGLATDSGGNAGIAYLDALYVSSLRDIRRTYQRAFKAVLFAHRLVLAGHMGAERQSELGFMLDHADLFAGAATPRLGPASFKTHLAWFAFDLLPVRDPYLPPAADARAAPSAERSAALFDWWERLFDYTAMRRQSRVARERPAWLLFFEALENQPDDPAQLLRHLGVDERHAALMLALADGAAVFSVGATELSDERWAVRMWHAERWLRHLLLRFHPLRIEAAEPRRWAADDPTVATGAPPVSGVMNLAEFLRDGSFRSGKPHRYVEVTRLNDGLRQRARDALIAYLTGMSRVPLPFVPGSFATTPNDLSELLLQEVCCGPQQMATRIEDAIDSCKSLIQRGRLGLDPDFKPTPGFIALWESRYADFRLFEACSRRHLYRENTIVWDDVERAHKVEAFRFLEKELRRSTLTAPVPGGLEWWPTQPLPPHPALKLLQNREPSSLVMRDPGPLPEGLDLMGRPERDARPSWLAPIIARARSGGGGDRNGNTQLGRPNPNNNDGRPALAVRDNVPGRDVGMTVEPAHVQGKLPLWIEAAVKLGARYIRVAAAAAPPASAAFVARPGPGHDVCCAECGCVHPPGMDEYYFWLEDARCYQPVSQEAEQGMTPADPTTDWDRPERLPTLLDWPEQPAVRLRWSRVHNGEFQPPRNSAELLAFDPGTKPTLDFKGRTGDSLRFEVGGGITPTGYAATPPPGFRYDIADDVSIVVPQVAAPVAAALSFGGLAAYPFFLWFDPGAPVEPLSPFAVAHTVALRLRSHCRFDAALKWYELGHDALTKDNAWARCDRQPPPQQPQVPGVAGPINHPELGGLAAVIAQPPGDPRVRETVPTERSRPPGATCCPTKAKNADMARRRATLLEMLETMLQWVDALLCHTSPSKAREAGTLLEVMRRILGATPPRVKFHEPTEAAQTVDAFVANEGPLNPRLVALYERTADRVCLIAEGLDGHRLKGGYPDPDACCGDDYWPDNPTHDGWRSTNSACDATDDWCECDCAPYRFTHQISKVIEMADELRSYAAASIAAFEKGDAECLVAVRAMHESQMQELGLEIRRDAWREADWQVLALQKTYESAQARLSYLQNLIANGLVAGEIGYETLTGVSTMLRSGGNISEGIAQGIGMSPDFWFGVAGIAGTPLEFQQMPAGSKLASNFTTAARIMNALAEISSSNAGLSLTEGGWARRLQEWQHQVAITKIEIEQIRRQLHAAKRRRDASLQELNNARVGIDHSRTVQDYLRDKLTAEQFYLYLQQENIALHDQTHKLLRHSALRLQRAFNLERGFTAENFLPGPCGDTLHEKLMTGERFKFALRRMEKAYYDHNCREYELTKHISLRLAFPQAFLKLQLTGTAEIEIPEWLFNLDYPSHYMRRIKSVSLSIPCVVGPHVGVHCRLTLLSSTTRIDPRLASPNGPCCPGDVREDDHGTHHHDHHHHVHRQCPCCGGEYEPRCDDPRFVRLHNATEAITTSSGQNDSGLFELNFHDERYLPFEFKGAMSRWRIEIPELNNQWDRDAMADTLMHMNLMTREGGAPLGRAATAASRDRLPGNGLRLIDLRHDMPDLWHRLNESGGTRMLPLNIGRDRFPFVTGGGDLRIHHLELFFELVEGQEHESFDIRFLSPKAERETGDPDELRDDFTCVTDAGFGGLYRGVLPLRKGRIPNGPGARHLGSLEFPQQCGAIRRAFLILAYDVDNRRFEDPGARCENVVGI